MGLMDQAVVFSFPPIQREPWLNLMNEDQEPCPQSILVLVHVIFRLISRVDPPYFFFKVVVYLRFYPKWFLGVILNYGHLFLMSCSNQVIFSSLEAVKRIRVTQE